MNKEINADTGMIFSEKKTAGRITVNFKNEKPADRIDLHNRRAAEVEPELSHFIDRALLYGFERLLVIHGKGSGIIRKEVWKYLKSSPQVKEFKYADITEGSFGATVVYLR